MSEVLDNIKSRRSVRKYKPDMVPQEIIDKIIEAGLYAPNGMSYQNTIIIEVTDKKLRDEISEMNRKIMGRPEGTDPFYGAPAMLIVLAKKDYPNGVYDGSLVMGNLMNAAHSLGVDSCWIHRAREVFDSPEGKELKAQWGVPEAYVGVGHCVLGYRSAEYPQAKARKEGFVIRV